MAAIFEGAEAASLDAPLTRLLTQAPWRAVMGVRIALWVAALAPVFVLGRVTTLARLAPGERTRVMGALLASPRYAVRQLALLLKMLGAFVFACVPAVRADLVRARVVPVPLESGPRLIGDDALVSRARGGGDGRRSA